MTGSALHILHVQGRSSLSTSEAGASAPDEWGESVVDAGIRNAVLEARSISKSFGRVVALDHVDFGLGEGEIHGLLGENGAGKSTLMNIFYGLYRADGGDIYVGGERVEISSPLDSINLGIGMIHQSSTLVAEFTVLENIILGSKGAGPALNLASERKRVTKLCEEFGLGPLLDARVKSLSAGIKQKVEIVRALYRNARILILDEPTSCLVEEEFEKLQEALRLLAGRGVSIVFITHKIREVLQACERASVLKGGKMQGTVNTRDTTKEELVSLMFREKGISVTDNALPMVEIPQAGLTEEPVCSIRNLRARARGKDGVDLKDISFDIYGGEIFGIAGISGNGQKELAQAIINPNHIESGEIVINGKLINGLSTMDVFSRGIFYTPEDQKKEGILPSGTIKENVLLGHQKEARFQRHGVVHWDLVKKEAQKLIEEFRVSTPGEETAIDRLSGGNIRRVVMGRAFINPISLLITHNPTLGLDMASVQFIFERLLELKQRKSAVLYINEDLDELMLISDRIGVLHEGRLAGIVPRESFDKYTIGSLMIGVKKSESCN